MIDQPQIQPRCALDGLLSALFGAIGLYLLWKLLVGLVVVLVILPVELIRERWRERKRQEAVEAVGTWICPRCGRAWPGSIRQCPSCDRESWRTVVADEEASTDDTSLADAGAWPEEEALFPQAVEIVLESGLPSAAKLAGHLQIDRPRARRLLDRMHRQGIIHVAPGVFE